MKQKQSTGRIEVKHHTRNHFRMYACVEKFLKTVPTWFFGTMPLRLAS